MTDFRDLVEACWKDYKQVGMKEKDGKTVPNCVPESEQIEESAVALKAAMRHNPKSEEYNKHMAVYHKQLALDAERKGNSAEANMHHDASQHHANQVSGDDDFHGGESHHWNNLRESQLEEAAKLGSRVKIHAPGTDYHGKIGSIGEIRHGAHKTAIKHYTIDYKDGDVTRSVQLQKNKFKLHKDVNEEQIEEAGSAFKHSYKMNKDDFHKYVKYAGAQVHNDDGVHMAYDSSGSHIATYHPEKSVVHTDHKLEEAQLDELSKYTLGSYIRKAKDDLENRAATLDQDDEKQVNKLNSRLYSVNKAKELKRKEQMKEEIKDDYVLDESEEIRKEYDTLKKHDIKHLRGLIKGQRKIVDTSEFKTKDHAISSYLRSKHGNKKVAAAFGLTEEQVTEGLASKIAGAIMGAAPSKPKYKVGQTVTYDAGHQKSWESGGRGKGKIHSYENGHYIIDGKYPVNHHEIKKIHEEIKDDLEESIVHTQTDSVGNKLHIKKLSSGTYEVHKQSKSGEWSKVGGHKSLNSAKQSLTESQLGEAKEYSHAHVMSKIRSGDWEATHDIKPGRHLEIINHAKNKKREMITVGNKLEESNMSFRSLVEGTFTGQNLEEATRKELNKINGHVSSGWIINHAPLSTEEKEQHSREMKVKHKVITDHHPDGERMMYSGTKANVKAALLHHYDNEGDKGSAKIEHRHIFESGLQEAIKPMVSGDRAKGYSVYDANEKEVAHFHPKDFRDRPTATPAHQLAQEAARNHLKNNYEKYSKRTVKD